jgi:Flp pilus assembly protein TadD/DNA-binding transcriptional regulator GbsR (MarR family)
MKPTLALHKLPLYNTGRLDDTEIIAAFAARRGVFDRIVADLAAEKDESRAQHHLLVGQRGMGKTMLLARIAAEIRTSELGERFIPLVFAEEQYAVDRLSKFWLNCLDSLADAQERIGSEEKAEAIDDIVQGLNARLHGAAKDDGPLANDALEAFLEACNTLHRRPVLLVDNLQLVFERISEQQQHALRETLMRPGCPVLVSATPTPPPDSPDQYGAAFYDHFKVHFLRPLEVEEMKALMLHLAEIVGRPDVRDRIQRHPRRLDVLRQLTGGNPRTTATLFFLYAEDFAPSVFGDLENLLDRVTPLYKARFEELSAQQQVIASAIANHWDPVSARTLADATGLAMTGVSPQLDRLEKTGFIEKVELFGQSATGFQIAERFFNVWFLMRSASRRQRREVEFLTRFIENFYEAKDRPRLAEQLLSERDLSPDRHMFAKALAATLDNKESAADLERHTQLDALRQKSAEAWKRIDEILDLSSLPQATLEFSDLREKLTSLVPSRSKVTADHFAEAILGDRKMFLDGSRGRLASRAAVLDTKEISSLMAAVEKQQKLDEIQYGKKATQWLKHRLARGLIRSPIDVEDWNRSFRLSDGVARVQIMVDSLPERLGKKLANDVLDIIRGQLAPSKGGPALKWYNWGYDLAKKLGSDLEAESAFRVATETDPTHASAWNGLGVMLAHNTTQNQFEEAEHAFRKAIEIDPSYSSAWNGLGNLLSTRPDRAREAEAAFRKAVETNPNHAAAWNGLGNLLRDDMGREDEAEAAYLESTKVDPYYSTPWNGLGNLYCDHLSRFNDAEEALSKCLMIGPNSEAPLHNLIFLRRDFLGRGAEARSMLVDISHLEDVDFHDTPALQQALFDAYEKDWNAVSISLGQALQCVERGFNSRTQDDWMRASAVILHLNYGGELLKLLDENGTKIRLRPWYEAIRALHLGDRGYLLNIAPEIRSIAERFYDQIELRLSKLPDSTRRRPVPKKKAKKQPRRK